MRRPARNSSPSTGGRVDSVAFSPDGHRLASGRGRHGEDLGRHAAAGEAVTARRTDAANRCDNAGGGSGPRSPPPPCSRTMSQPGDGPWFVPENSYVSSERPQTTLCRDAVLAWPSSSRLPVEPTAPAATPAWARWVDGDGGRAPIERRPPLRGWEQRIAGHARGTPPRIESSKDSDFLIGGASFRADRAPMNRWAGLSPRIPRG